MPSIGRKIRSRVLTVRTDAWNHPHRVAASIPICFVLGSLVGFLGGVHWVPAAVPEPAVTLLFGVAGLLLGTTVLAIVD